MSNDDLTCPECGQERESGYECNSHECVSKLHKRIADLESIIHTQKKLIELSRIRKRYVEGD